MSHTQGNWDLHQYFHKMSFAIKIHLLTFMGLQVVLFHAKTVGISLCNLFLMFSCMIERMNAFLNLLIVLWMISLESLHVCVVCVCGGGQGRSQDLRDLSSPLTT